MIDEWRPIDEAAISGELIKERFSRPDSKSEIVEYAARYISGGAWLVFENGKNGGTALDAIEWRPLRADE